MKPLRCEYPIEPDACGRPATWETDDLADVNYLCDEHVNEALLWNDFVAEPVST